MTATANGKPPANKEEGSATFSDVYDEISRLARKQLREAERRNEEIARLKHDTAAQLDRLDAEAAALLRAFRGDLASRNARLVACATAETLALSAESEAALTPRADTETKAQAQQRQDRELPGFSDRAAVPPGAAAPLPLSIGPRPAPIGAHPCPGPAPAPCSCTLDHGAVAALAHGHARELQRKLEQAEPRHAGQQAAAHGWPDAWRTPQDVRALMSSEEATVKEYEVASERQIPGLIAAPRTPDEEDAGADAGIAEIEPPAPPSPVARPRERPASKRSGRPKR